MKQGAGMTLLGSSAWHGCGVLAGALLCLTYVLPVRLAQYAHRPVAHEAVRVHVPRGASPTRFAEILSGAGLATWEKGTLWAFRMWGNPGRMKAGIYTVPQGATLLQIFDLVEEGRVDQVAVTLPEGRSAREMASLFEAAGVVGAAEFTAHVMDPATAEGYGVPGPTLEGYLFPDTYRFAPGVPVTAVVEAMVQRFREVTEPLLEELNTSGLTLKDWVTLASIVEKETGDSAEKTIIAGVFWNRLRAGMRLESDPTVIYGIEGFDGNLKRRDLERDTPYNTYTRKGLPPGAIANPGAESLLAVLRPDPVPYLYFVSRNDGTHVFSATYGEHRAAVERFQKRRKKR